MTTPNQSERMQAAQALYERMMRETPISLCGLQLSDLMRMISKEMARLIGLPNDTPLRKENITKMQLLMQAFNKSLLAAGITPFEIFSIDRQATDLVQELEAINDAVVNKAHNEAGNKPFDVDDLLRNIGKS